ncbi:MAG: glycosyltransferase family 2 protein, partial [Bacteroidota bacterium]
ERSRFHVSVHDGEEKPDDWLGKNWACHQLAKHAKGEILIFLDADTWLSPSAVRNIMESVRAYRLDFATVWPQQVMETTIEKAVISTVYSTIALYLPARYSYRAPRWIPFRKLREKVKPMFASACGQCMIFTKDTYQGTGGHAAVKDQVVEDVMLAKRIVRAGKTMRMFHGTDHLWCRMYKSGTEVFHGFRKNFFAGFGYRFLPFMSAWALHVAAYLLPPAVLVLAVGGLLPFPKSHLLFILSFICVLVPFLQRLWVSKFLKWPVSTAILYLPGVLWFQVLAVVVIRDRVLGTGNVWKGRPL